MTDTELLPCPRCCDAPTWGYLSFPNGHGSMIRHNAIRCLRCHYWFYVDGEKTSTAEIWNTRPTQGHDALVGNRALRMAMFLEILQALGGSCDASDDPWNWIKAFCEDYEGIDPDTFNSAERRGFTTVSHDTDTDNSIVHITEAGRAAISRLRTTQGHEALVAAVGDGHAEKQEERRREGYGAKLMYYDFHDPGEVGFDAGWLACKRKIAALTNLPTPQAEASPLDDGLVAELADLLDDVQFLLDEACQVPRIDPANSEAVSRLGDRIGYGALMSTASAIWRVRLGDLAGGEFCSSPCRSTAKNLRARVDAAITALRARPSGDVGWQPIETAPKDGTRILAAKFGWTPIMGDLEQGSAEWKARFFDPNTPKEYRLWWMTMAWWSEKWNCWFDGQDPSGLSGPTHYIPCASLSPPEPPALSTIKGEG